jgi:hypothetical protein
VCACGFQQLFEQSNHGRRPRSSLGYGGFRHGL